MSEAPFFLNERYGSYAHSALEEKARPVKKMEKMIAVP
jgi:hypothetical protein